MIFIDTLKKIKKSPRKPIWLMRQAGRYMPSYRAIRSKFPNFMEMCMNVEAVCNITHQPINQFGFDAAIIFSDILTIPHLFGQTVHFNGGPKLASFNFQDLQNPINFDEKFSFLSQSIQQTRASLPNDVALIGFAGAPWTLSTYMIEEGKTKDFKKILSLLEDPLLKNLLDFLSEKIYLLLELQIKAGANALQIFDTWASAVPKDYWEKIIFNPMKKILLQLQTNYPDIPVIYFGRNNSEFYFNFLGLHDNLAFSLDQFVSRQWAKETLSPHVPLQGNIDPLLLVEGGEGLKNNVLELLECFKDSFFVVNLGHGVVPQTPEKHVLQLVEWVKSN